MVSRLKTLCHLLLALLLVGPVLPAASVTGSTDRAIEQVFDRLYNNDLVNSERLATGYTVSKPQDPMGFATRATVLLYREMQRLDLLGDGMFSEAKVKGGNKPKPDKQLAEDFWKTSNEAIKLGKDVLAKDPQNKQALLALAMAYGTQRDFAALVEKRLRDSLTYARDAQANAVVLLKVDPQAYDAYLTTGFTDYLLGSLPFFVKWVVKFDEVEANKEAGIRKMSVAAKKGSILKPFAQMMLATLLLKDKRKQESEQLLAELSAGYPENPAFARELEKLKKGR